MGKKTQVNKKLDAKLQKIIDEIAKLTVLELSDLVKSLEEKFDIKPMAAVAGPVASGVAASNGNGKEAAEEKTVFTVVLTETGAKKIEVIKALREVKPDLGLKDAKDLTEKTPAEVLTEVKKEEAEEAKKKLEAAGAKVELK